MHGYFSAVSRTKMLSGWVLFASSAIAIEIPSEWREVIHNLLCSEANNPPCTVQLCYGRHDDRMQVNVDSQNCRDIYLCIL